MQPALATRRRFAFARVSSGHVVMLLAGALGVLLTLSVLRSADRSVPVVVAARDLPPGTVVGSGDVRIARVHAAPAVLATLLSGRDISSLRGQVVASAIRADALVGRDAMQPAAAGAATRVMSFPLARARAVDGKVATGDHVDVVAVEHNTGRSGYVVTDAEVAAVDTHGGGPLGASDDVTVSLIVDGDTAPRLVAALDAGMITLVRATGAPPLRDAGRFNPSGAPR